MPFQDLSDYVTTSCQDLYNRTRTSQLSALMTAVGEFGLTIHKQQGIDSLSFN